MVNAWISPSALSAMPGGDFGENEAGLLRPGCFKFLTWRARMLCQQEMVTYLCGAA